MPNGCLELDKCTLRKKIYQAYDAQSQAEISISNARSGILSSGGTIKAESYYISVDREGAVCSFSRVIDRLHMESLQ